MKVVLQEPAQFDSFIRWPDLTFPPINLWTVPYQVIKYKTDEYKTDEYKTDRVPKEVQIKRGKYLYRLRKIN